MLTLEEYGYSELYASLAEVTTEADYLYAIMNLQNGMVDAVLIDEVVAQYKLTQLGDDSLVCTGSLCDDLYGIGFRKADEALEKAVYDTLIEMERPYGRTLATSCEVNGVPSDMTLVVNEDGTGKLTISNDNGIDELDGTWTDWANFNLIYQDWPEKGKDMLLKKHGIYLRFAGEEPGTTGLKPSDFDIRITFTYEFDTCDVREAENGKYLIYSPLKGSPVDFKSIMSSTSPLMQPIWRVMD